MGREIRRVPPHWEHPRDEGGHYKPLHDEDYETAAARWKEGFRQWEDGTHESLQRDPTLQDQYQFWEYHSGPPDPEYYRPQWTEEPTCYQVYETVSEGTPKSPVFEETEQVIQWLVDQGHSEKAAQAFVRSGWAPSGILMVPPGGRRPVFTSGIEALALIDEFK